MPLRPRLRDGSEELQVTWERWTREAVRGRLVEPLTSCQYGVECEMEPVRKNPMFPQEVSVWVEGCSGLEYVQIARVECVWSDSTGLLLKMASVDMDVLRDIRHRPIRLSRCLDPQHPDATYDGRVEHYADLMDIEGRNVQPQMYREVFAMTEWSVGEYVGPNAYDEAGGVVRHRREVSVMMELRLRGYHVRGLPEGPWSYEQRPL
jgi:hypothetical protein